MSAKRRLLIACTLITAIYHFPAYSSLEYKGTFGSINAGYADWNSGFVNTHRGEVWKVTADFGVNFKEAEFYSFYESNVLNHAVAGRNHTVSAMTHVRLFDSDMTFFGKIYGQWDNSWVTIWTCFMDSVISAGTASGAFLNRILDYIINLVTTYQLNMVKRMVGMVMLLAGQQYCHLCYLTKNLFYLTGMK